jgi:hypothetical protein
MLTSAKIALRRPTQGGQEPLPRGIQICVRSGLAVIFDNNQEGQEDALIFYCPDLIGSITDRLSRLEE